jgi:large repetitive protein
MKQQSNRHRLPAIGALLMAACASGAGDESSIGEPIIVNQGTLTLSEGETGPASVGQPEQITVVITNPSSQTVVNAFGGVTVQGSGIMQSAKSTAGRCLRNGPPDWICFFGDVAPGASITVTAVVVPSLPGPLQIESAAGGANDMTDDLSAPVNIAAAPTDVQITGFASTGQPPRGSPFSFTFQVKNGGPFGVADVTFSDTLPDGFPVNGVIASAGVNCSSAGQAVTCDLGGLAVGAQAQIVVSTSVPATALIATNTASVTSSSPDSNPANNSVGVTVQVK